MHRKLPEESFIEAVAIGLDGTLQQFPFIPFQLKKALNIIEIKKEGSGIIVKFEPESKNKLSVYSDLATIVSFIGGLYGNGALWDTEVDFIGVQEVKNGEILVDIVSGHIATHAIMNRDPIAWLKNSHVNDRITEVKEITFFVEGPTEENAFPILFAAVGFSLEANGIHLKVFSQENLKTILRLADLWKQSFFILFDKDKAADVKDCIREGLLSKNYHIFERGEFEDYMPAKILADALNELSDGLSISPDFIQRERHRGKKTIDIIGKYYHDKGNGYVFPGKPALGKKCAILMVERDEIPDEISRVIMMITNLQ